MKHVILVNVAGMLAKTAATQLISLISFNSYKRIEWAR